MKNCIWNVNDNNDDDVDVDNYDEDVDLNDVCRSKDSDNEKPMVSINLRAAFQAPAEYVFITADYSQIELRLLAHFSEDISLIRSFHGSGDIFKRIAATWLKRDESTIGSHERDAVKQLCYAHIYGCGATLIAENAHVSVAEATTWMKDFKAAYPGIGKFMTRARDVCKKRGGVVETLLGRKRKLPGILSHDRTESEKANRQVINTLCQGSAADLLKVSSL